ncbi:hypothetical protein E3N88_36595 [Mikania micrantha]|uniref:WRKY domain-containing protein n=1 Tax=Mikania micrantha TaxID=192012 RepID=A0A5N6M465_9ASTR|nr:hypothetical protein E3N88_36595 [Mikania micrantha]
MDTEELAKMMMVNMENNPYNHHHHHHGHDHDHRLMTAVDNVDQTTSLGFMELLGYQDYNSYPSSIFDDMTTSYHQLPPSSLSMEMIISSSAHHELRDDNIDLDYKLKQEFTTVDEVEEESSSVVLNGQPSSPNCSPISSPSHQRSHNPVEQCIKDEERVGGDNTKTKKKKKEKEPRFAFMTRTEIDHLDDGYRWRKYGQKAVKNSHFPRCTSTSCNVKKRVERCMDDPSCVITTYEGKHNHPVARNAAPLMSSFNHLITTTTTASAAFATNPPTMLKLQEAGLLQDMLHCHY